MIDITPKTRQEVLARHDFTCQKCGFKDDTGKEVTVHVIPTQFKDRTYDLDMLTVLCNICHHYAPNNERYFKSYINEKIDGKILDTFRRAIKPISVRTKEGMQKKLEAGLVVTRPPKGYKIVDGKLIIDEPEAMIVKQIFEEYISSDMSLNKLSKKYGMTTPGLIKLLKNPVYIGEISVKGKSSACPAIINKELWDKVQKK